VFRLTSPEQVAKLFGEVNLKPAQASKARALQVAIGSVVAGRGTSAVMEASRACTTDLVYRHNEDKNAFSPYSIQRVVGAREFAGNRLEAHQRRH